MISCDVTSRQSFVACWMVWVGWCGEWVKLYAARFVSCRCRTLDGRRRRENRRNVDTCWLLLWLLLPALALCYARMGLLMLPSCYTVVITGPRDRDRKYCYVLVVLFIYLSVLQRIKKSYSFHTKKLEALGHCIGLPPPTHVLYQCRNPNPDPYPWSGSGSPLTCNRLQWWVID